MTKSLIRKGKRCRLLINVDMLEMIKSISSGQRAIVLIGIELILSSRVRRNTISSQYNDFLIIIYPMKNDLYKISVQRKDNVKIFLISNFQKSIIFPWIDDMIVTWDFLPSLILVSVASAYKSSLDDF
jgi:hypothetical protein